MLKKQLESASKIFDHQIISFIKSVIRVLGLSVMLTDLKTGIVIVIVAEFIGIIEEI